MTGNIDSLLEAASAIASDVIPTGGSGEGAQTVLAIFKANPSKYFTGKALKGLFESENVEIKAVSNILHGLAKSGAITRVKTGVYQLAQ